MVFDMRINKIISDLYEEYGFTERLTMIESEFPGANIICSKLGAVPQVRRLQYDILDIISVTRLLVY